MKSRCSWVNLGNPIYIEYHDKEWGRLSKDDGHLFEMLILEGAQAGLNWETVLNKREGYREAFCHFIPEKVAVFTKRDINRLLKNPDIIRNRLKVESTVKNAKGFLAVQEEFGSFYRYLTHFVSSPPVKNRFSALAEYPTATPESQALSKDLKKRGFSFVGPTIMYAYMQAVGLVNDHMRTCYLGQK